MNLLHWTFHKNTVVARTSHFWTKAHLQTVLQSLRSPVPSTSSSPPLYFPEGVLLKLPIFSALRALSSVAIAYDLLAHIYDPTYLHVLPAYSPAVAGLPANLHPVSAQLTIPHHPLLDVLPWPSVREKLICMLSMPSVLRPPVAREESDDHPVVEVGVIKQGTAICIVSRISRWSGMASIRNGPGHVQYA